MKHSLRPQLSTNISSFFDLEKLPSANILYTVIALVLFAFNLCLLPISIHRGDSINEIRAPLPHSFPRHFLLLQYIRCSCYLLACLRLRCWCARVLAARLRSNINAASDFPRRSFKVGRGARVRVVVETNSAVDPSSLYVGHPDGRSNGWG